MKKQKIKKKEKPKKKQNIVLISAVCLIIFFVLGGYLYKSQQAKKLDFMARENASTFVRDYSLTHGSDDAKVYIVEFFDPACETCRDFYPLVKNLMAAHQGKTKLVVRYAPFHEGSDYFVKILEAARKQGKYWETLEVMYKYQHYWASHHRPQPELIWQFLPEAGLNVEQIRNDMNDPEIAKHIEQDLADAKTLNVRQTPEFFVNGRPLPSFGANQLKELVESEVQANY
ncbi:MAG: thioredoxin domain-containing protein [Nitrospirae bacterium]|nr:thioredoxin domain-containing protein [Nitrospirota bacterium]